MNEDLGPVDLRQSEDHPFLGQSIAQPRNFADDTAARVDRAVIDLLKRSEKAAEDIITGHREEIQYLIRELEEKEVLNFEDIRRCLDSGGKVTPIDRRPQPTKPKSK